jgi:hypothetical protein
MSNPKQGGVPLSFSPSLPCGVRLVALNRDCDEAARVGFTTFEPGTGWVLLPLCKRHVEELGHVYGIKELRK